MPQNNDILPNCVQHAKAMEEVEKEMVKYRHTHCLICGEYKDLSDGTPMHEYICSECMSSFPIEYINFRLDCYEKGIRLKQFDNLEMKLAGMKLNKEDLYEREHTWNWDQEEENESNL